MKKTVLFIIGLLCTSSLFAADAYLIETQIIQNGEVIDTPSLIAPFHQAATAEAVNGKNKYELLAEVDKQKNSLVVLYTNLTLNGKFYKQKATIPLKELVTVNMNDVQLKVRVIPYQ